MDTSGWSVYDEDGVGARSEIGWRDVGLVHGDRRRFVAGADRATQVSYELNVIDGWTRVREWTDESGLMWEGESTAQSRVREVLDAASRSAQFIAAAHLWWIRPSTLRADIGGPARRVVL